MSNCIFHSNINSKSKIHFKFRHKMKLKIEVLKEQKYGGYSYNIKHLKFTYIDTNKSWADIKAGRLRMWHPFLVYTDKPTKALDQLTANKCRKTGPHSRLIHTFHVLFWAEDAYFSIHTTICFHTFKQLKCYNLICNFQSGLRKSNSMRPSVFSDMQC